MGMGWVAYCADVLVGWCFCLLPSVPKAVVLLCVIMREQQHRSDGGAMVGGGEYYPCTYCHTYLIP